MLPFGSIKRPGDPEMLELFPQGLPADPQDPGRLNPIALGEPEHGDDVLSLCLFAHFAERLALDRRRDRV
jgi:hypothetical protein